MIIKGDIQEAAGTTQLCGGQISGIEAAVHATRTSFENKDTEATLFVAMPLICLIKKLPYITLEASVPYYTH